MQKVGSLPAPFREELKGLIRLQNIGVDNCKHKRCNYVQSFGNLRVIRLDQYPSNDFQSNKPAERSNNEYLSGALVFIMQINLQKCFHGGLKSFKNPLKLKSLRSNCCSDIHSVLEMISSSLHLPHFRISPKELRVQLSP